MKRMKDYGGQATCKQLSVKYGESVNFYNAGSSALARRVAEKTGCPIMERETEKSAGGRFFILVAMQKKMRMAVMFGS